MSKENFERKLLKKLIKSGLFDEIKKDKLSDNSSRWIELVKGDKQIVIEFDKKGNKIIDISVWKDVVEVVSQEIIF
jgi:hypothetical protein